MIVNFKLYQMLKQLQKAVKAGRNGLYICDGKATTYKNAIKLIKQEIKNARRTS